MLDESIRKEFAWSTTATIINVFAEEVNGLEDIGRNTKEELIKDS